ncbi:hypothetical protein [Albimonas pacifica]|uniref:Uncharacterized protein n=1 Tax=Albimonas pacifica TaxID=1114924 RepID=A0A1I3GMG2_9RHOB|nr:hypothetical protein [Albimonas pacifica]SFI24647.1 hypothetical protein SAMN05216258_105241 [Albimonas pacifica]
MTTPYRSYLRPADRVPAVSAVPDRRARFFGGGEAARGGAGGRPPPLKAYARLQTGAFQGGLRLRHVAILAVVAAVIVYVRSQGG